MGIRDRPTSFRSPWQNGHVERLIGSARHECTDDVIVFNEEHLRRILSKYASYYNEVRTRLSVGKDAPTRARSSGSGTLSRNRSLAGYTIDTCEFEFSEGTP
jgi:transposase InsO family protein